MSLFLNSATVAAGTNFYCCLSVHDEDRSDLYNPRFYWEYQGRAKESANASPLWQELWHSPKLASGDSTTPGLLGQDPAEGGRFEYPSTISRGMARPWFFRGFCKDNAGNILGGAVVTAYLTQGDVAVGTIAADSNGYYECPTPYFGVNHYLVARYASANLAGATVNTLQPSL
jgi:hypothetical protein